MYDHISDIWLFLAAAFFTGGLALYALQYRSIRGAVSYAIHKAAISLMLVSLIFVTINDELAAKIFWVKIYNVAIIIAVMFWLALTLRLNGHDRSISIKNAIFASILPAIIAVIIMTSHNHIFYFKEISLGKNGFKAVDAPLGSLVLYAGYLILIFTITLFIRRASRIRGVLRTQALIMIISTFITFSGHISWRFAPVAEWRQVSLAAAFIISGLMDVFALFHLRMFDIVTAAQDTVAQNMGDGLLVLDGQGVIIGMNPAAGRMLGKTGRDLLGIDGEIALGSWPSELGNLMRSKEAGRCEIWHNRLFYSVSSALLSGWNKRYLGKALVFHDGTVEKTAQQKLLEQEQALAVLKERDKLGREIHDNQGQLTGYFLMQLETIRTLIADGKLENAEQILKRLTEQARDLNTDVRESISGLKTRVDQGTFLITLDEYMKWFSQSYGIKTSLKVSEGYTDDSISPLALVQVQRIIHEAMANVRKHASAGRINITVQTSDDAVDIIIEDDGIGFDMDEAMGKKGSYGLNIMRERAEEIGAFLSVSSRPAAGAAVNIHVPLKKAL